MVEFLSLHFVILVLIGHECFQPLPYEHIYVFQFHQDIVIVIAAQLQMKTNSYSQMK